jgi:hypothetical protein
MCLNILWILHAQNLIKEPLRSFREKKKNVRFDNGKDVSMSSKNYEKNGHGLDLDSNCVFINLSLEKWCTTKCVHCRPICRAEDGM